MEQGWEAVKIYVLAEQGIDGKAAIVPLKYSRRLRPKAK